MAVEQYNAATIIPDQVCAIFKRGGGDFFLTVLAKCFSHLTDIASLQRRTDFLSCTWCASLATEAASIKIGRFTSWNNPEIRISPKKQQNRHYSG